MSPSVLQAAGTAGTKSVSISGSAINVEDVYRYKRVDLSHREMTSSIVGPSKQVIKRRLIYYIFKSKL